MAAKGSEFESRYGPDLSLLHVADTDPWMQRCIPAFDVKERQRIHVTIELLDVCIMVCICFLLSLLGNTSVEMMNECLLRYYAVWL
jgi:hypothetical protein